MYEYMQHTGTEIVYNRHDIAIGAIKAKNRKLLKYGLEDKYGFHGVSKLVKVAMEIKSTQCIFDLREHFRCQFIDKARDAVETSLLLRQACFYDNVEFLRACSRTEKTKSVWLGYALIHPIWNQCLKIACENENKECAMFMVECGATLYLPDCKCGHQSPKRPRQDEDLDPMSSKKRTV